MSVSSVPPDSEFLLSLDDLRRALAAEHPDWSEDKVLTHAARLVAFHRYDRAQRENSDREFRRHTILIGTDTDAPEDGRTKFMGNKGRNSGE